MWKLDLLINKICYEQDESDGRSSKRENEHSLMTLDSGGCWIIDSNYTFGGLQNREEKALIIKTLS